MDLICQKKVWQRKGDDYIPAAFTWIINTYMGKEADKRGTIMMYKSSDGSLQIKVIAKWDTVWLTQEQLCKLYGKSVSTVSEHINNIYAEEELEQAKTAQKESNSGNSEIGYFKPRTYYNLEMILAVGYRVKSPEGIAFRRRATTNLKELFLRGFVMDDQRLTQWTTINGKADFDELLRRVREIRFSERSIYEKIKELISSSAMDYDPNNTDVKKFFAILQNKFIYAITRNTAAELIVSRIDSAKPALGMTNFKGENIKKSDAIVSKNYLLEKELKQLYLLCEQFFSFAELQLSLERELTTTDWLEKLDQVLEMSKLDVLDNPGKIGKEDMEEVVKKEIEKYIQKWWSVQAYIEYQSEF